MDVEHPYADGPSRRQLLYRLCSAPAPRRLLLIRSDAEGESIGAGWPGPVTLRAPFEVEALLAQAGASFDAVALPGTLGPRSMSQASAMTASELLRRLQGLLVPDGVVVGHLPNARTLRRLVSAPGLIELIAMLVHRGAIGSAAGCKAALLRAGYVQPECWYLQPNIASPRGLIPAERAAARAHFLRSIRSAQGHYSRTAYAARLFVAALGLSGMQQGELFFWARKPC